MYYFFKYIMIHYCNIIYTFSSLFIFVFLDTKDFFLLS